MNVVQKTRASRYNEAREIYAENSVDTEEALRLLQNTAISMQCWQGDDVRGFESAGALTGGIAVSGNYPGAARGPDELMMDIEKALSLIPGPARLNLHASYAICKTKKDRDELEPEDFSAWLDFARKNKIALDFNPTFFGHPKAAESLTLTNPDSSARSFWIAHGKASRKIAAHFGKTQGCAALNNIWIPDGYKDIPADRRGPRERLKQSLDEIFSVHYDGAHILDCLESKVFGLGLESYTAGSHEFCMNYAAKNNILYLLDAGHFHPTELISDKIPSLLLFSEKIALHVSRPVRWDSDHVVIFDDELKEIAKEIVRCNALERVLIGMDFFDASINRIAAWVCGMRNMKKALLYALLLPHAKLSAMQNEGRWTDILVLGEEFKFLPFADVWNEFCERGGVPLSACYLDEIKKYEAAVLSKRNG
ncbi:MAG: L-rhamnose isomerase [Spirochaetaceae bacterium]|jgi:L-rhamnose isomerase|nr:L-rhamnose isomerase [Spirochaetaceae bacterium]